MIHHLQDTVTLNNGVEMPGFGLGVYKVEDGQIAANSVEAALKNGYRSIDTASFYQNERGVGQGIRASGVPREDIFVTSKVWNDEQGYDQTLKAFETSLEKLGLDYLDLYLIHWPVHGMYQETWKAMEKLYETGNVRAIGVSNFHIHHLQNLMQASHVKPVIDQVEYHPHLTQEKLKAFCDYKNIQLEAWSPLKRGRIFDEPVIANMATKYSKTPAQIILRWNIQNHVVTIPKSTHEQRIRENADVFNFSLTDEEMGQISNLNINDRVGSNPNSFDKV
ncbi:aldo/keto reductase [Lentibacillus halophilus]|uniref:Aldo/keto reductase n=1 Tax=Lentibacillus halophilus TaxID=295065 RepID=A0ABN0ZGI4_9BACI